ncbi:putative spermidine/putrescine transport system permease protein/spermidine/putrescine transport system permease protein [Natrinema hispanicum]|uniref:Putative spermidine/putrescine transport system permease protein/spermidine/putrescine transport system permease protein n=1 Tax=Natrinema hispanicum TaxID=392421 RepID=A0A482Y6Y4_9EURY|nr:ABC transporter permease [Natrinema hispanicum]RZV06374.1 putative spermidine/putrescine transport system permease protein/spermidine/putrescine transport system permease protein [Natrinema hispanicum]
MSTRTTARLEGVTFRALITLVFAFLLLPVLIVILTSFTPQNFPAIPQEGFSLKWYQELLADQRLLNALTVSLIVSTVSAILSAIIGTIAAIGFVRGEFPYKEQISTVMLLPMIISPVITGIALVRYFSTIQLPSGFPALILGHTVLSLPYVFLLVRSELLTYDRDLERASRVLGADPATTFRHVTGPIISPAILAGAFIAFVVSFGEFTATQFLISPGTSTVPVVIYTMLRTGLTPTINALSVVLIVVMLVLALASRKLSST